jgi:hypothetical protein
MALQASAYVTVNPAFHEPEILLQYSQPSGFVELLADSQLRVRLAEDDLLVYIKQLNLRTKIAAGTASFNELPGVDIAASMISTPTYMFKVRSTYDHHDVAAGGRWGFSTVEAYRLGMRQANFQLARDAALHGMNPQNGEGILNAPGALITNLPPDSHGATTVLTYDNGEMAFYLAQVIQQIKTRTLQLGIGKRFTILGPQRVLGQFEYNIVQLVQYQRPGAGSTSTAGTVKEILMANGDTLAWCYDDTLIGAAAGGLDAVIVDMPEVTKPAGTNPVNTNEFAKLAPGNAVCVTQYCDMGAPREIISPMAGGATDFMMEWRCTSGWAPRGQAVTVIGMQYQ